MRVGGLRNKIMWLIISVILVLFGLIWQFEVVQVQHLRHQSTVKITFLIPMHRTEIEPKLSLIPENPLVVPKYSSRWVNPFTLLIEIQEPEGLQGQELTVRIERAATKIPFLKKSVRVTTRRTVRPELRRVASKIPSTGPVEIVFNTPLRPGSVSKNISLTLNGKQVKGTLTPRRIRDGNPPVLDYATWLFHPKQQLPHSTKLELTIGGDLQSAGGLPLGSKVNYIIRTASELKPVGNKPADQASGVDLHPEIQVEFNQPLSWGSLDLENIRGRTEVWANKVQFLPLEPLMPDREYTVHVQAVSRLGEKAQLDYSFQTRSLGDKMWVAVDLEGEHNVTIYRGSKVLRVFKASGGKVTTPTPLGTYFLYSRGFSFWNQRLQEGAYYWVQFSGPYLVHSVPFDASGNLKQEEIEKLGQAASHGCVRLSLEDAKWFFHHIPNGTMIVIYNQH